jgi:hypothetical protein
MGKYMNSIMGQIGARVQWKEKNELVAQAFESEFMSDSLPDLQFVLDAEVQVIIYAGGRVGEGCTCSLCNTLIFHNPQDFSTNWIGMANMVAFPTRFLSIC